MKLNCREISCVLPQWLLLCGPNYESRGQIPRQYWAWVESFRSCRIGGQSSNFMISWVSPWVWDSSCTRSSTGLSLWVTRSELNENSKWQTCRFYSKPQVQVLPLELQLVARCAMSEGPSVEGGRRRDSNAFGYGRLGMGCWLTTLASG